MQMTKWSRPSSGFLQTDKNFIKENVDSSQITSQEPKEVTVMDYQGYQAYQQMGYQTYHHYQYATPANHLKVKESQYFHEWDNWWTLYCKLYNDNHN